jgi:hypothetical protein
MLTDYVRTIRRVRAPAFLTLSFAQGEWMNGSGSSGMRLD